MQSFQDKRGALWVSCSECDRGGNVKKFNQKGCFSGTLMGKYKDQTIKQI